MHHWLLKTEPESFSVEDLAAAQLAVATATERGLGTEIEL